MCSATLALQSLTGSSAQSKIYAQSFSIYIQNRTSRVGRCGSLNILSPLTGLQQLSMNIITETILYPSATIITLPPWVIQIIPTASSSDTAVNVQGYSV